MVGAIAILDLRHSIPIGKVNSISAVIVAVAGSYLLVDDHIDGTMNTIPKLIAIDTDKPVLHSCSTMPVVNDRVVPCGSCLST